MDYDFKMSSSSSLAGKVILLTGAASGIGGGTAIKLHKLGAVLAITDINEAGITQTLELCGGGGNDSKHHTSLVLDVSNAADVAQRVAEIVTKYGHIDHVFNCAGVNPTSMPLTETSEEYFDKLVGVNLKGMYNVTKATIPHMTTPGGSYVNVSSISGWNPCKGTAIYCATKFGVIGFSKCMALELGPKNIRVNVITPGYIDTPTNAGIVKGTPEARKGMEQGNALGRMGTPDDIAGVVAFLMSDEARYMNGSVVGVDGMLNT
ncbi:3-oxoacyl-reductase [Annulohypoxylon truncatum]|uniref:3-oxoacyl-reductase n=1 Tax=Annulohypoxylon truncatum TaxID=327061 RepID=UPI00200752A9|nr:3-oxoacyl-reductase [Annulohypoxylon truncatum]KAI1211802.1 3-oxoacyl-reductase [Annulohypoxylon truncatum]